MITSYDYVDLEHDHFAYTVQLYHQCCLVLTCNYTMFTAAIAISGTIILASYIAS